MLLSSQCILHHSLCADEVPTFDSKGADAELNSATGMQESALARQNGNCVHSWRAISHVLRPET